MEWQREMESRKGMCYFHFSFALSVRRCDTHPVGSRTLKAEICTSGWEKEREEGKELKLYQTHNNMYTSISS